MPFLPATLTHPAALGAMLAATKAKTSSGSPVFFIFLIIIVGVYFLFIAPQRRKMRAQANQQATHDVGDDVVTKGGIFGRVLSKDGDRVRLEVSPGFTMDVLAASIARRVDPVLPEEEHASDEEGADVLDEDRSESEHWTEPVHEGWNVPAAEGTSADAARGHTSEDSAAGGPA